MGQHFLLRAAARTFGVVDVCKMSDDDIHGLFCRLRWPKTGGEPVCPKCGCVAHYAVKGRQQWRCKGCNHTFSVTSGTMFHSRKLPLRYYLLASLLFSNAVKSLSALQLARDLRVQHKTAYVLAHKLRDALLRHSDQTPLTGTVEIDGGYVGGSIRPANKKEDRVDARTVEKPNKRCILVLRQRGDDGQGACRTVAKVIQTENADDVLRVAGRHIARNAEVHADEHRAYDGLAAWFDLKRVNHGERYRGPGGENVNQAESFISRFRRMELGQIHHIGPAYLEAYANATGWREDNRRLDNGAQVVDVVGKALRLASSTFRGYWQRSRRKRLGQALLGAAA